MRMVTPVISVNGCPVPARWGRNEVPVPPGRSRVHVHLPSAFPSQVGAADAAVWLRPGETVELEYRAPMWAFSRGALGPAPQKWPGRGALLAVVTPMILALFVFVFFLVRLLS